jgi:hypothetical protein
MLYMFQAVPPPIISSSKLYIQHWVLVKPLLLPAPIVEELEVPDDGRRYRLKYVEYSTEINKLCNVSCWLYLEIYLWCMDPWMSNDCQCYTISLQSKQSICIKSSCTSIMHCLLLEESMKVNIKIHINFAPACFGSWPSSGSIQLCLAKVILC